MIYTKIDILDELKKAGYSTYRIRQEKIFGQGVVEKFRKGAFLSEAQLNKVCALLGKQPGDVIGYRPDEVQFDNTV